MTAPYARPRPTEPPAERHFLTLDVAGWEEAHTNTGVRFTPLRARVIWAREWADDRGRWDDWYVTAAWVSGPRVLASGRLSKREQRTSLALDAGRGNGWRYPCPEWLIREIDGWRPSLAPSLADEFDLDAAEVAP